MPWSFLRFCFCRVSKPVTQRLPVSGVSSAQIKRARVDLPEPVEPIIATCEPFCTSTEMFLSTGFWYENVTSRTETAAGSDALLAVAEPSFALQPAVAPLQFSAALSSALLAAVARSPVSSSSTRSAEGDLHTTTPRLLSAYAI